MNIPCLLIFITMTDLLTSYIHHCSCFPCNCFGSKLIDASFKFEEKKTHTKYSKWK